MKKGLIFATTLAMALGVGVAVGAHQGKAAEVEAAGETTLYLDTNDLTWYGNMSRAYLYGSGGNNTWPGQALTHVSGSIYKLEVANMSNYQNVIFLRTNGTDVWNRTSKDGKTAISLPANWATQNMWKFSEWDGNEKDNGNETGSWTLYTPPATTYSVTCVVDGVAQTPVEVGEGDLPDFPDAKYGKEFSGWCSDSACTIPAVGVTSDTTIYSKYTALPTYTYTVDDSRVEYGALNLYAFDTNGKVNAGWPGEAISNKTITVPNNATIIINDGTNQTVNVEQSKVANDVLRILSSVDGEGHNEVVWESAVDEPAEDGYYLVRSGNEFKFKDAPKMATTDIAPENVAELMNYSAKKDEKIKVRGFFRNDVDPDKWSFYDGGAKDFGDIDGDANFVFSKAQAVDIFAKWVNVKVSEVPEKWEYQLKFYVTEHAERYNVSIYDVLFEGKRLASTSETPHVARATEGVDFEYDMPAMDGYRARKLYKDAACTVEYTPTKYTADATLYAKYTRLGYYVTGDENFSGEDLDWDVDGAVYLPAAVNDTEHNLLEGTVTIPASASVTPISVKPLQYKADGTWQGVDYTLGTTYSFCHLDSENPDPESRSNLVFTKGGTFAVYVNKSYQVWLNEGADAFYTKFLTDTGAVCKTDNKTDLARLGEVWTELEGVYNSLSKDEKDVIVAIGFNGGDEKGDDLHKVIARYAYIVTKYGSATFKNFIFGVNVNANSSYNGQMLFNNVDNTMMFVIIAIAATGALAFGTFFYLKKRKQK